MTISSLPDHGTIASLREAYGAPLDSLREELRHEFSGDQFGRYLQQVLPQGKLFRPMLVFAAGGAFGTPPAGLLVPAKAVEVLHAASLIHDDVIDGSARRRDLPAAHVTYGVERAIVLGDHLLLRTFSLLAASEPVEHVPAAIQVLAACAQRCCAGEIDELATPLRCSFDRYLSIAERKTGSQLEAAVEIGAIFSGADPNSCDALRRFARALGIAFQIADDLLELLGDPIVMGKPGWRENGTSRPNAAVSWLISFGSRVDLAQASDLFEAEHANRADLVSVLSSSGAVEAAEAVRDRYLAVAMDQLDRLAPAARTWPLRALAEYAIERTS